MKATCLSVPDTSTFDRMSTSEHYEALFSDLQREIGPLGPLTTTGIVGFSAGGPVSILGVPGKNVYVTCELSLYQEQIPNTAGERYEFLTELPLEERDAQILLTELGNLSMEARLEHGHTVDVSPVCEVPGVKVVRLQQRASCTTEDGNFGVLEVCMVAQDAV